MGREKLHFYPYKKDEVVTSVVVMSEANLQMGLIEWFNGWKRYCYIPDPATIYDSQRMKEISAYIDELMELREKERGE